MYKWEAEIDSTHFEVAHSGGGVRSVRPCLQYATFANDLTVGAAWKRY
jgi:hypothetical protein